MTEIKFEDALTKLEKIVEALESGDLPLEQAIAKYEEGMNLSQVCSQKLEAAQKKIEILVKSDKGKPRTKSFSPQEEVSPEEKRKKAKKEKVAPADEEELLF